jgi:hypothetical protein
MINVVEPIIGSRGTASISKMLCGFFRSQNVDEIRKCARDRYREHYETIRRIVPEENLLNFNLSDGWAPLCAFLDKEVPDVDFPWVNETKALQETIKRVQTKMLTNALRKSAPVAGVVLVLTFAWYVTTTV